MKTDEAKLQKRISVTTPDGERLEVERERVRSSRVKSGIRTGLLSSCDDNGSSVEQSG